MGKNAPPSAGNRLVEIPSMYDHRLARYRQYLVQQNLRWTWQQRTVAGAMFAAGAFVPDELCASLAPQGITRPSFHRILGELLDASMACKEQVEATCIVQMRG